MSCTMQWCGSILCQVRSGVYALCSAGRDGGHRP